MDTVTRVARPKVVHFADERSRRVEPTELDLSIQMPRRVILSEIEMQAEQRATRCTACMIDCSPRTVNLLYADVIMHVTICLGLSHNCTRQFYGPGVIVT